MAGYTQVYDNGMGGVILRYNPDPIQLQQQAQQYQQPQFTQAQQDELQVSLNGGQNAQGLTQSSAQSYQKNINDMVDAFRKSVKGAGTDDDVFEAVLKDVNKDNIMDVIKTYNKYYSKGSDEDQNSFIKAFLDDADASQLREYGPLLAQALRDRAEELDVWDEEMAEAYNVIFEELNDSGWHQFWCGADEDKLQEAFETLIDKISMAEADQIADAAAEEEVDEEDQNEAGKKAYDKERQYVTSEWTSEPVTSKWESVA